MKKTTKFRDSEIVGCAAPLNLSSRPFIANLEVQCVKGLEDLKETTDFAIDRNPIVLSEKMPLQSDLIRRTYSRGLEQCCNIRKAQYLFV